MFKNSIAFKMICTIFLFITMGISQVSITIENANLDNPGCSNSDYTTQSACEDAAQCSGSAYTTQSACEAATKIWSPQWHTGTVDLKMTNTAGCSYCDDPLYNTQTLCESSGNNTAGGTWMFDANIDKTTCESSAKNGAYFDGSVAGFEFYLKGIKITSVSGGTAGEHFSAVQFAAVTGKLLGYAFGDFIAAGSAVLTTIGFSDPEAEICFVGAGSGCVDDYDNDSSTPHTIAYNVDNCAGTATQNIVSDTGAKSIRAVWGDCIVGSLAISQIDSNLPSEFSISQNFPNPFNPETSIAFEVAEMDEVSLIVYDLTGREVVTLVSGIYTPGTYNVEWNAVNNAGEGIVSGMYIYRYISSEKAITRKMLYLK